ncbi:PfkB family carbohydrate kinase [Roseobacter sp. HKCCA0434]|uniref:PfkB family carbohydrate kinase n=1 Tax=Roseobacter sp. HKCCA0434 TaxID=3079297 RepID=UPI0029058B7E|nr:PfkB family carbohydrate kinase [Roseobacter sp. HKCCA0434]
MTILCAGAAHWDILARAGEAMAPGDDVPGRVRDAPGGVACNIARHVARRGRVALAACVGDDARGRALLAQLQAEGIDTREVAVLPGLATDRYVAIEDHDGGLIGAVADQATFSAGAQKIGESVRRWDGPVLLDGNMPARVLGDLPVDRITVIPASPAKSLRLREPVAAGAGIVCNAAEARVIARAEGDGPALAEALVAAGAAFALVTDGARTAAICRNGRVHCATPASVTGSVTGAGDALTAAFTLAIQEGLSDETALKAGVEAAARHIEGTSS